MLDIIYLVRLQKRQYVCLISLLHHLKLLLQHRLVPIVFINLLHKLLLTLLL